jgi:hypothetical protein
VVDQEQRGKLVFQLQSHFGNRHGRPANQNDSGSVVAQRMVVSVPLVRQRQKVRMILQSDTARQM